MKVNFSKSRVFGIGAGEEETREWAGILGCVSGSLPFQYLGVPVGANLKLVKNWQPIIDRFHAKLSIWKATTLSFGGRLTLVKSVLGNLPNYYLSLFKAPVGIMEKLEAIRRRFLWGGGEDKRKIHWVAWDKVVAPKKNGGLGIGSIQAINIGLLVKWWWRLKTQSSSLWCKIIHGIHELEGKPHDCLSRMSITGVWKNISDIKKALIKYNLGFDDIFERDSNGWNCKLGRDKKYQVAALRGVIDNHSQPSIPVTIVPWRKEVPSKVLCFTWRAAFGRLPTADALTRRGISIPSPMCSRCNIDLETVDHILFNCPLARSVWLEIWKWCKVDVPVHSSVGDVLAFAASWGRCPKKRYMLLAICYGVFWTIWKMRNDRVFNKRLSSTSRTIDEILSLVFSWFKYRGDLGNCNWVVWCMFPFDCL